MVVVDLVNTVYVLSNRVQGKGKEFSCWDLGGTDFVNVAEEKRKILKEFESMMDDMGKCLLCVVVLGVLG